MRAVFVWRYLDQGGEELGSSERFADRESAEAWIGETWSDLYERGVEEVELVQENGGGALFRMGLAEG